MLGRWSASSAARNNKLVVPSAFVEPDRAEHTTTTLCWSKYDLRVRERVCAAVAATHGKMSSAILAANLPTLVPPYFCTSQVAAGSMLFWWRLGGVGGVGSELDEVDDDGEDGVASESDISANDSADGPTFLL